MNGEGDEFERNDDGGIHDRVGIGENEIVVIAGTDDEDTVGIQLHCNGVSTSFQIGPITARRLARLIHAAADDTMSREAV